MARIIENYQDIQDAIRDWLNRPDLVGRIPTFIYLAERKMFRRYRSQNNEKTITYDMRVTPDGGDPTQIALSDTVQLPADYLELLTIQANDQPVVRESLSRVQTTRSTPRDQLANGLSQGVIQIGLPTHFTRERRNLLFNYFPEGDTVIKLIYYCDMSGLFISPTSDHDVLRTAPDLYLYGSLMQAQPFLKPTDDEWQLIPVWEKMYEDAFMLIEFQRDEDERSGSNVEVQSSFDDSRK